MYRKLVQFGTFLLTNSNFHKTIYQGKTKQLCIPGIHCYACPLTRVSCPMGSFQHFLGMKQFPLYVFGFIGTLGVVWGRLACGFFCPFGLVQELLYKIKTYKIKLAKVFNYGKYVILFGVAIIVVWITGDPWFCKICPSGILVGGIPQVLIDKELRPLLGWLFYMKYMIILLVIIGSIFIKRVFCRTMCPLGAMWGLFNKVSFIKLAVDKDKCIQCGMCEKVCPTDVKMYEAVDNPGVANTPECVRCFSCKSICPMNAIKVNATGTCTHTEDTVLPQQSPTPVN
ncbi:MAG: 4Fe-4S binding protein [bacterium]